MNKIQIKVNGKSYKLNAGTALKSFLEREGFERDKTLVSIGENIVQPEDYAGTLLNDGDSLDLMTFVGGG
jgi:thiamine biosynthesis protein ThiS